MTIATADAPSVKILTSDVYEWMPEGFFVLHTAYGRIGNVDVGGTEIIGYDSTSKTYRSHFFDSQGIINMDELTVEGDTCFEAPFADPAVLYMKQVGRQ